MRILLSNDGIGPNAEKWDADFTAVNADYVSLSSYLTQQGLCDGLFQVGVNLAW